MKKGLTQSQLADLLNISASSVGMYEQGRREPNNRMLFKICKLFNVSSDYILDKDFFKIENPKIENFSESQEILIAISEFIIMLKCHKKLTLNGMILTQSEKEKIILQLEKAMKNVIKNCNSI